MMRRLALLPIILLLAGCARQPRWTGYAFPAMGAQEMQAHGPFATLASCRAALLALRDGHAAAGLVCGLDCPPARGGEVANCRTTEVVAVTPAVG